MAAAPEPGRPRRSGWWRRGARARLGPDAMAAVAEGRRVAASVRAGLDGPGALAAARRLRRLL
ncbi:MAG: hypothetical protein QOI10_4610, partial [Solirubrobacterales bacterium]|nr:hypothetical protein [Solirubrobacterales bacterium]